MKCERGDEIWREFKKQKRKDGYEERLEQKTDRAKADSKV